MSKVSISRQNIWPGVLYFDHIVRAILDVRRRNLLQQSSPPTPTPLIAGVAEATDQQYPNCNAWHQAPSWQRSREIWKGGGEAKGKKHERKIGKRWINNKVSNANREDDIRFEETSAMDILKNITTRSLLRCTSSARRQHIFFNNLKGTTIIKEEEVR